MTEGSPAEELGVVAGDRILQIDDRKINSFEDLSGYVAMHPKMPVLVVWDHQGQTKSGQVVLSSQEIKSRFGRVDVTGFFGVASGPRERTSVGPLEAVWLGLKKTGSMSVLTVKTMKEIVIGKRSLDQIGGPVKITEMSGEMAQTSFTAIVMFTAALSISLGVLNLFPIPMLDGGHLLFYAIEAIRRKPVNEKAQEISFRIGMAAILTLMVLVTWNDITSLIDRLGSP